MTVTTTQDAIKAATSIARDVADGRLSPADLEAQAVAELKELVGTVVGPGDACWPLQVEIASQAVALGAIEPDTLREWAVVLDRQRGVEPSELPAPHEDPIPTVSSASVDESPHSDGSDDDDTDADEPRPDVEPESTSVADHSEPQPKPQRPADGYNVLRGFNPGSTRRAR